MKIILENEEYISLEEVSKEVGFKGAKINQMIRFEGFPKPRKIEVNNFWKKSDIEEYLKSKDRN